MISCLCWPAWLTYEQAPVHGITCILKKRNEPTCCIDLCCLFSPLEGDTEVPAPDVDIIVEGEEVKEEQQEKKEEEEQAAQVSEVKKVNLVFLF